MILCQNEALDRDIQYVQTIWAVSRSYSSGPQPLVSKTQWSVSKDARGVELWGVSGSWGTELVFTSTARKAQTVSMEVDSVIHYSLMVSWPRNTNSEAVGCRHIISPLLLSTTLPRVGCGQQWKRWAVKQGGWRKSDRWQTEPVHSYNRGTGWRKGSGSCSWLAAVFFLVILYHYRDGKYWYFMKSMQNMWE